MKKSWFTNGSVFVFALAVFAASSPASGAEAEAQVEVESPEVTAVVRQYFTEKSEGGLAVLVIDDGEIIHCTGYGVKNGTIPIAADTKMGLASVSKQFAAMCVAMLIEEGKLSLGDKVSDHLPDLPLPKSAETGRELLVQDLVWHTSGLVNFIKSEEKESIARYKKARGLERLSNKTHADWLMTRPLRREPGTEWEYTNSGYVLLARIVEVIAGESFHDFQKRRIFDRLDMNSTGDSSRFNGSGNMTSTLLDYAKWDRALREGALLSEKTSKLLYESGTLDNGEKVDYGFGWHLGFEGGELIEMYHGGAGSAPASSRNFVLRDVRNQITVAFFGRENLKLNRATRSMFATAIRDAVLDVAE